jgi:hypothetical protein
VIKVFKDLIDIAVANKDAEWACQLRDQAFLLYKLPEYLLHQRHHLEEGGTRP